MSGAPKVTAASEPAELRPWRARLLGTAWATALRLQLLTWRVRSEGLEPFDADLAAGRGLVAAFWHGQYVPLFVLLRNREAVVFTSLSFRGAIIAEISRRFGYRPAQIPDRGGDASLVTMRRVLARAHAAGFAVDGPLGPYHAVKRGPIQLASELGWRIYPVAVASSRKRVFPDRWDRREIPRLFARLAMVIGEPLEVPAAIADPASWCQRLAAGLDAADQRAAELLTKP